MLAAGVKVARIYKIHIDAANVIYQRVTARERERELARRKGWVKVPSAASGVRKKVPTKI